MIFSLLHTMYIPINNQRELKPTFVHVATVTAIDILEVLLLYYNHDNIPSYFSNLFRRCINQLPILETLELNTSTGT